MKKIPGMIVLHKTWRFPFFIKLKLNSNEEKILLLILKLTNDRETRNSSISVAWTIDSAFSCYQLVVEGDMNKLLKFSEGGWFSWSWVCLCKKKIEKTTVCLDNFHDFPIRPPREEFGGWRYWKNSNSFEMDKETCR